MLHQTNQRTNGPVNAHLTSGPGMSTISNFDYAIKKISHGSTLVWAHTLESFGVNRIPMSGSL